VLEADLAMLERRCDVISMHIRNNSEKIRKNRQESGEWDTTRINANIELAHEIRELVSQIQDIMGIRILVN
jgi:hypothetical protein